MTEILKEEQLALTLMDADCSMCVHSRYNSWGDLLVCDGSGEKCLPAEVCEEFEYAPEKGGRLPLNSGARIILENH